MSVLLSAITFNPAMTPHTGISSEGFLSANVISPDKNCAPGGICASAKFNKNGCYFNNFWNSSNGGTPLTIDVTQTGNNGSAVYVYWVNATNKTIAIKNQAEAKYYCP